VYHFIGVFKFKTPINNFSCINYAIEYDGETNKMLLLKRDNHIF